MEQTIKKRIFKMWWGWNPEKIEKWLEKMALKGWILQKADRAITIFTFKKESPQNITFCADFNNSADKEYFSIAEQAGWERVSEAAGWHLWAKKYTGKKPLFLSDKESHIKRLTNLLLVLSASALTTPLPLLFAFKFLTEENSLLFKTGCLIYIILGGFIIFAAIRILLRIRSLKKKSSLDSDK